VAEVTIQQALAGGLAHHRAGRLAEAEGIYRQILAVAPEHPEACNLLGVVAMQTGRFLLAVEWIGRAAALEPASPAYAGNLGEAFRLAGRMREAVEQYRRAIALQPNFPDAFANLSLALSALGELDEAIAACRSAIALKPDFVAVYGNLCEYLRRQGRLEEAVPVLEEAILRQPGQAILHHNLGFVLAALGRGDEAVEAYRKAIELRPESADAHFNLANALSDAGWIDEAIAGYERAVALDPRLAGAYVNLGNAHRDAVRLDEAMKWFREAMRFPTHASTAHSNVIIDMLAHPAYGAKDVLAEATRWAQAYAEPLMGRGGPPRAQSASGRRLRIGYLSADFRGHVVGRALWPVLREHDRSAFEIACYSSTAKADAMTAEMRQRVDLWRDVAGMPDDQLAQRICEDGIDILVDLSLHMRGNRLLVLARKPAPVQATWLGYPSTTGLRTVDYRLSDPFMDPPGGDEAVYVEETLRLPDTFQLYGPPAEADVEVNELPARTNGFVTFGCLNNFFKVNDAGLGLFANVVRDVPKSRLILLAKRGRHQERTRAFFAERGVDGDRILFPDKPHGSARYLSLYHDLDVALDPFPYNGHTTSCDGFWMGVPVVSLVGKAPVGRAGWSQLSNLGLTELAAHAPDEYVAIAKSLAGDLDRLAALRSTLRQRLIESPLMDAPRFARAIEAAYRQMWRESSEAGSPTKT
jgi:predicted O-linked N-acetylglucosamine transferase (SPINDLY family)